MSNDAPTSADRIRHTVEVRAHGWRLDHYLTRLYPNFSRSAFQRVIDDGQVFVNGLPAKISRRLRVNDVVEFRLPESADRTVPAEDLPLDVLYDDDQLIVINKAANMIVHPGRGRYTGTLVGALQFHFDQLSDAAGHLRAGIVHRLDRDTTGVLVVAKDNTVHNLLSKQFEQRTVEKEYRALVWNEVSFDRDYMETHVRVSNRNRERMMVCPKGEPPATPPRSTKSRNASAASATCGSARRPAGPTSSASTCTTWATRSSPTASTKAAPRSGSPTSSRTSPPKRTKSTSNARRSTP